MGRSLSSLHGWCPLQTRSRSLVSIAPLRWRHREGSLATARAICFLAQPLAPAASATSGQTAARARNTALPPHQKILEITGFLYPPVAQRLVREIVHVLEDEQPGQPAALAAEVCPGPTRHTELKRFARKSQLNLRRKPHQRMGEG